MFTINLNREGYNTLTQILNSYHFTMSAICGDKRKSDSHWEKNFTIGKNVRIKKKLQYLALQLLSVVVF